MEKSPVTKYKLSVFTVPTETEHEADGTLEWSWTTMVLVELFAADRWGLGYTYGHKAIAAYAKDLLEKLILGQNAQEIERLWGNLTRQVRNDGRNGLTAMAISAIDNALWDLKAKILGLSLSDLLGRSRERVEVYGSGGFTSQSLPQLRQQMQDWRERGVRKFKMKVGMHPDQDSARVHALREFLGTEVDLMVDANEAYDFPLALKMAEEFARDGVSWFEQPLHCTEYGKMHELRLRLPPGMQLADGEYIYDLPLTRNILEFASADVVQLDTTRCQGITGFLKSAALCEASHIPISSHCAPSLHAALGCSVRNFLHIEYFFDHARIEKMAFEGAPILKDGHLTSRAEALGFGLSLKAVDMEPWRA